MNILEPYPRTRQEFEQWCNATYPPALGRVNVEILINKTPGIPFSMKAGLCQEYFQSVGIVITIAYEEDVTHNNFRASINSTGFKGRQWEPDYNTALTVALQAAAQLREKQLSTLNK